MQKSSRRIEKKTADFWSQKWRKRCFHFPTTLDKTHDSIFLMQTLTYRSCKQAEKNQSQQSFPAHVGVLSSDAAQSCASSSWVSERSEQQDTGVQTFIHLSMCVCWQQSRAHDASAHHCHHGYRRRSETDDQRCQVIVSMKSNKSTVCLDSVLVSFPW